MYPLIKIGDDWWPVGLVIAWQQGGEVSIRLAGAPEDDVTTYTGERATEAALALDRAAGIIHPAGHELAPETVDRPQSAKPKKAAIGRPKKARKR